MGGGTEREFYVFEIAFPTDSGGKICEHYMCERFDKFLSSLFQMSKGQEGSEETRIEEGGNDEGGKGKRKKKCKTLALARDRFSSLLLSCVFLRNPEEARPAAGFCPSRTREDGECQPALPSLSLPSRDSSQFFFELFVSNFTSPPCHVASSFFFPVCPSAIRGVDERARSSCFTSLAFPPLSALLPSFLHLFLFFSPFLRSFALLIHFTTVVSSPSILRPPFSCLSVVSSLLPPALRSPPCRFSSLLRPGLILSLFCRVRWFHLLVPSFPLLPRPSKTLFSRGPFASMVIRHPSLLSFSLFSSFFSYPNRQGETTSPFPRAFFPISPS